jgi:RNA polymerase sigma factor (sigma-70 family)
MTKTEFERLFSQLEKPVYNVVYRWLWREEEAADVVQESFLKLWRMRDEVRPETVEALIFRIAVNLASNRRRRNKLWQWTGLGALADLGGGQTPEAELRDARDRAAVRGAIDALPEKLRRVVIMTEMSGLSYAEVAVALDIPEGTVGSRRSAALSKLRGALGGSHE